MGEWLAGLPLWWGKVVAVVCFAGVAVWAWRRPRSYIYNDAPDEHRWRDLRVWASVLMAIQVLVYLAF
ncbi:MAG: hypothetical protein AMS18_10900 [Gemmatimonas sp. SG8_17]|nr:MAG: hypothetical protein AMS18_10900 [Gemmatimonas sp. SG8_17]